MVAAWRGGAGRRWAIAALLALACLGAAATPPARRAQLALFDAGAGALRLLRAPAGAGDVVIVGIDDASLAASGKPFALVFDELAQLFDSLRAAPARAVAVDLELPARGYETLVPGASRRLALALAALRDAMPLALGAAATTAHDDAGRLYAALAGAEGLASLRVPLDADGTLRRIGASTGATSDGLAPLAPRLAARLGHPSTGGLLDFTAGAPFDYVPLHTVLAAHARADRALLRRLFDGKVVVVGAVLPDQDRQRLPLQLAAWEHGITTPGVVFQAQALRCLLAGRLLGPSLAWEALLAAGAALALGRRWRHPGLALPAAICGAVLAGGASLLLLAGGTWASPLAAWLALGAGAALAWLRALGEQRAEQRRLRGIFAGYVSPAILDTILSGDLRAGLASRRQPLAFLFADIRGFTAFCAVTPPERVIAFLNRYYGAITVPLHAHGGTIDKFSGDGIMVFFGAPGASPNPARDAVLAALGLLAALEALNAALAAEGQAPIAVGIGIAYGEAVLGNVGSPARHDYTATGAATTRAAHLQQLCKELPYALLVERDALDRAGLAPAQAALFAHFDHVVAKHGPMALAGHLTQGCSA